MVCTVPFCLFGVFYEADKPAGTRHVSPLPHAAARPRHRPTNMCPPPLLPLAASCCPQLPSCCLLCPPLPPTAPCCPPLPPAAPCCCPPPAGPPPLLTHQCWRGCPCCAPCGPECLQAGLQPGLTQRHTPHSQAVQQVGQVLRVAAAGTDGGSSAVWDTFPLLHAYDC
jgi:hypothetical protein